MPSTVRTDRLRQVVGLLPVGTFTARDFSTQAKTLHLAADSTEVLVMLDHLTEARVIRRVGPNLDMWLVLSNT